MFVTIGFLKFVQSKSPQHELKKLNFVYLFLSIGIIVSTISDILVGFFKYEKINILFDLGVGACIALSMAFGSEYVLSIKRVKKTLWCQNISIFISIVLGTIGYLFSKFNINALLYMFVFAVVAIYILSQYQKVVTDNLTKLYNRYGMELEIKEQVQQYARHKEDSFFIIACDLDNFKYINDSWGHKEGDRALILIAASLLKVAKRFDAEVFRIGGDEFVIITDTPEEEITISIIDAVKNELDNIDFREDFNIKMSMGYSFYDGVTKIEDILKNADKKLYEAKKSAKNN